ncbi:MAG TPA: tRNA lysidine(34) synthetase TilS [Fibrobacteria bacterium]|nr:tRNA lysidine(34) synthetase TilS [Fibrobacteria bacterium]
MADTTEQALDLWDQTTRSFLASQGWHPAGSSLLLAVSGGADSVALLHWARRTVSRRGGRLAVAHVNHGLRPAAAAERDFVSALCRDLGIPCHLRDLDPGRRPARESVEMWARRERYGFFAAAARLAGADWILTAHHRDDLVETVFQRLGRGTGPRGLRGIPFRRAGIVRPLLSRSRAEILAYLGLCGASWREDESNADVRLDRNWYRHRYLPSLRRGDPGLDARVFALAMQVQSLGKGVDALEEEAALLRADGEGMPYLDRAGIAERVAEEDLESLGFWMRRLTRAAAPGLGRQAAARPLPVTKEILLEFCRQWKSESGPGRLQVPLNAAIALKCRNGGVYCAFSSPGASAERRAAKKSCSLRAQRVILIEGFCEVSWRWGDLAYTLAARRFPRPENLEYPASGEERAIFDADLFSCTLLIRTRKDGDRFSPLGVQSRSRKLKTFFNEEKVPIGKREMLPIVFASGPPLDGSPADEASGGGSAAWVPGLGISDFFKVSGSTSHILELVLKCENP